jgi:hypothetical protein
MTEIYNSVMNDVNSKINNINSIIINTDPNINTVNNLSADCVTIIKRSNEAKKILLETIIPYYNDLLIKDKNLNDLYNMYLTQNQGLDSNIKTFYGDTLTNNRKTFYESMALETLINWNTFFMYLYFTLLFSFILGIIFSPHILPRYQSITIIIILFLYPFLIESLVTKMYNFFGKIYNLYPKNVYNKL